MPFTANDLAAFTKAANDLVLQVILNGGNTQYSNALVTNALRQAYLDGVASVVTQPVTAPIAVAAPVVPAVATAPMPAAPTALTPAELLAQLDTYIKAGMITGAHTTGAVANG